MTTHHIICKAKRDAYNNLTHTLNTTDLSQYHHERHHIGQEENAPHETLAFYSFFMQVMSRKAQHHMAELLRMSPDEFYNPFFLK